MKIYRKPTTTDITIKNNSCHPKEQKLATYKNWIHRLHTLPLNTNNKNKELSTITNIGLNNGYKKEDILQLYNKFKLRENNSDDTAKRQQKWVSLTYTGHYIRKITKLFKDTNIKIAYKSTTTLDKLLNEKQKKKNEPLRTKWNL
jgi:hypothetical protein